MLALPAMLYNPVIKSAQRWQTNGVKNKSVSTETCSQSGKAADGHSGFYTRNKAALCSSGISFSKCRANACSICTRRNKDQHCRDSHHPVAPSLQSTPLSSWSRTHLHGDKILLGMARARILLPEMQCYLGLGWGALALEVLGQV